MTGLSGERVTTTRMSMHVSDSPVAAEAVQDRGAGRQRQGVGQCGRHGAIGAQ